ncbi:ABC transporter ATP-binding protein, partial [Streptococcus mutans]|nr:ABC transporter ATP-binding protein [Streptococcus mutans]
MVGFLRINHVQKIFKATDDAHTEIEALHQINTDI